MVNVNRLNVNNIIIFDAVTKLCTSDTFLSLLSLFSAFLVVFIFSILFSYSSEENHIVRLTEAVGVIFS